MTLPTKEEVLQELANDYQGDVLAFMSHVDSNVALCEKMNELYANDDFKPFPTDYFEEQKRILLLLKVKEVEAAQCGVYNSVDRPYHYTSGKYECLDVMRDVFGDDKVKIWCQLNAFKYLYRSDKKNGDEDLDKARFYLEFIKTRLNGIKETYNEK